MNRLNSCIALIAVSTTAWAQSALNNEMIVKLAASGMPEPTIVGIIQSQPGAYATAPKDLAALQQAGLSPNEITAMLQRGFAVSGSNGISADTDLHPAAVALRDGTPIRLRLTRTLSSSDVTVGEKIDFDVLDDVRVGNRIVVSRGTKAIGAITLAEPKKRMGRAGKLNFMLEQMRLADNTRVTLRADRQTSGQGHVGAMATGMVVTALFVPIAAPLFLMMHGKDAVIPEGTEITAYVDGDVQLAGTQPQLD
jgi:hypothetical protein